MVSHLSESWSFLGIRIYIFDWLLPICYWSFIYFSVWRLVNSQIWLVSFPFGSLTFFYGGCKLEWEQHIISYISSSDGFVSGTISYSQKSVRLWLQYIDYICSAEITEYTLRWARHSWSSIHSFTINVSGKNVRMLRTCFSTGYLIITCL